MVSKELFPVMHLLSSLLRALLTLTSPTPPPFPPRVPKTCSPNLDVRRTRLLQSVLRRQIVHLPEASSSPFPATLEHAFISEGRSLGVSMNSQNTNYNVGALRFWKTQNVNYCSFLSLWPALSVEEGKEWDSRRHPYLQILLGISSVLKPHFCFAQLCEAISTCDV